MVRADILASFPILGGRHSTSISPSSVMLAVVYFEDSFHQVKGILFYSKFAENFFLSWMNVGFCEVFFIFRWSYDFSFLHAKWLQSRPTLRPHGLLPTRLPWWFSKQVYWSGLPFPPLRDLPDSGIESAPLMPPAFGTASTEKP